MAKRKVNPRVPDNVDIEVGRRVRVERIVHGLSQTEFGKRIGVTYEQVQHYESGAHRISIGRLTRIGRVFGVHVTYLLGVDGHKARAAAINREEQATASEVMRMLGRSGAVRLLRAFAAISAKPVTLRESIVHMVEGIASAVASVTPKQTNRK